MQAPYSSPNSPPNSPLNAPVVSSSEHAPMPLRARGVLEQLDLAIKVYRRNLSVLLSWSALVLGASTIVGLLGLVLSRQSLTQVSQFSALSGSANQGAVLSMLEAFSRLTSIFLISGIFIFLGLPLIFGAVACVTTAAVRGQKVEFEQCWDFTKPRYGGMILQVILAGLLSLVIGLGVSFAFGIIIVIGGLIVTALARSVSVLAVIIGVVGGIALYFGLIVLFMALYLWLMMIPIIACMEDNHRTSGAIGRSSALMRGGWWRAAGLMLLTGIAIWIAQMLVALVLSVVISGLGIAGQMSLLFLLYMTVYALVLPFYAVIAALFYLDQRVRHEALDLEWASYSGAESTTPNTPTNYAQTDERNFAGQNFVQNATSFSRPDEAVFNATAEDIALMPLDAFEIKKPLPADNAARSQAGADISGMPQSASTDNSPTANLATNDNATQILAQESSYSPPSYSPSSFSGSADAQSSTRDDVAEPNRDTATKTCASCGAQVALTQNFCLNCGTRLSTQ